MRKQGGLYDLVRGFFKEVWNDQNDAALSKYVSPNLVERGLQNSEFVTMDFPEFVAFRSKFLNAFPDVHFSVDDILVEGDWSVVRYHIQGTHLGDGMGVPATGRAIAVTAMGFGRWENELLVEVWNNYDELGLMRQMGVIE